MKSVFVIAIVFSITIALVGVVAMTNTANAELFDIKRPMTLIQFAQQVSENAADKAKAAADKVLTIDPFNAEQNAIDARAARAAADTRSYGHTYNAPSIDYGSSAYNTPQAPSTNYGSSEPYVPPKLDFKPIQTPEPKYQFKEPDRSVITDHKLDIPKINPMPEIPVPLPGCGIGCIPEVLKLP